MHRPFPQMVSFGQKSRFFVCHFTVSVPRTIIYFTVDSWMLFIGRLISSAIPFYSHYFITELSCAQPETILNLLIVMFNLKSGFISGLLLNHEGCHSPDTSSIFFVTAALYCWIQLSFILIIFKENSFFLIENWISFMNY